MRYSLLDSYRVAPVNTDSVVKEAYQFMKYENQKVIFISIKYFK